ncbi:MAG: TIGR00289 family protein [Candidatus Bathyarchaeota archaeon]|nr:TIGR00289 family protein [Candidatus Bathyarchaeota archaeon]
MRIAALISGGKDSALALHRALKAGHTASFLVTILPRREDSWMFHYPNIRLTTLFAEATGIPLVTRETAGIKEDELKDLRSALAPLDVDGVVSGAIASQYQKERIDAICRDIGLESITPLWLGTPVILLNELVDLQFKVIITGVYAHGFDPSWLGTPIDASTINKLVNLKRKHGISLLGEGGEYETLTLDAPFFRKEITLLETEKIWSNHSGWLHVKNAQLVAK